jgi:adenylate cyclase
MPQLVVNPGTANEYLVELSPGSMTIGRSSENRIAVRDLSLSRVHARFDLLDQKVVVTDQASRNGTSVNGTRIDSATLRHGDLVRCGGVHLLYLEDPSIVRELPLEETTTMKAVMSLAAQTMAGDEIAGLASSVTRERLRMLLKVSEILSSPGDIDGMLRRIVDLLFQIVNISRATVLIRDEASGELVQRIVKSEQLGVVTSGEGIAATERSDGRAYSRNIVDYVLTRNVAVMTTDARRDERFAAADSILTQEIRASLCAPLRAGNKTIGVLYVDNVGGRGNYGDEDLDFLGAFANQAAIAIENSRLIRRIEEEAVLRNTFLRFFPPATIRRIVEDRAVGLGAIETEVTALFADISGFTDLSASRDPREVVDMLNDYFPVMSEVIFRNQGTLEKYIGDAMMAVWGAPFRQDDDVDRAVRAAVEMQQALERLNASWAGKWTVRIHVGLNTGRAAAGNIGSERYIQYATIGDAVNVASRISNLAQAGEILLSGATFRRMTPDLVPCERLEPAAVKGKSEAVEVYRVDWRVVE